jgi:starvation-inducible DNA-binding protein
MSLAEKLTELVGCQVSMWFSAKAAHWNIEGSDFPQLHELFDNIAEDVYGSIDPTAENLRKIEEVTPYTLSDLNKVKSCGDIRKSLSAKPLLSSLYDINEEIITCINEAFQAAVAEDEQGIANFLSERDNMHKKWAWQLRVTLK